MIRIYLSINNGAEVMELPVIPSEYNVTKPQQDETFETITGEELAFLDAPGLKTIGWSSFFPCRDYPYLRCARLADVWQYGYKLDTWIAQKYPIRLIISGTPINMAVKVTQFDYRQGTSGDIEYDVEFKEFPLVDTETEALTMAQYDELKGMIDELSLKVDALGGGHVINSVEDAEIYYQETLRMLLDKNYLTGSDGGPDLTEDMARILTIVNRSGGFHTGMIYNYNDSNITAAYRESLGWYITNGYLQGDETGELGLTEDMLRILKVFYDVLTAKKII